MDLKDFVKQTLVQITAGVKDAQGEVRTLGGIVNPATRNATDGGGAYFSTIDEIHHVFLVDFDVAVTVTENSATDAGAKINVAVLKLGAGGESSNSSAATNRLTFKVPLALPLDEPTRSKLVAELERQRASSSRPIEYP